MSNAHNYKMAAFLLLVMAAVGMRWESAGSGERGGGLTTRTNDPRRHYSLSADAYWHLAPAQSERFDGSALVFLDGKLLTLNDRQSEPYEIQLLTNHSANLVRSRYFSRAALITASQHRASQFDCEALALDDRYLYLSEESQRSIFRTPRKGGLVERLAIDWKPVAHHFKGGSNASFEGIAVGGGKLYVANEREDPRIIVVNLETLLVEDSFVVDSSGFAFGGPHYSDLAFHKGSLFVLDRNHRCILEVNPRTKKVEAEYAYGQMELAPELAHRTDYPTGTMEGLAVDGNYFWLVTDNNGHGRFQAPEDTRPTLFRCKRPRK